MTKVIASKVHAVGGSSHAGTVTIHLVQPDGLPLAILLPLGEAIGLVQTLHQVSTQVAKKSGLDPVAEGVARSQECHSLRVHYSADPKVAFLLVDQGLPSQVSYALTEKHLYALGQGVTDVLAVFGRTPTTKKH